MAGILNVVDVEAVVVAHEQVLTTEREVRVRKAQPASRPLGASTTTIASTATSSTTTALRCRWALRCSRPAGGRLGVVEALRLGQVDNQFHVACGHPGIPETSCQADARISLVRGGRSLLVTLCSD